VVCDPKPNEKPLSRNSTRGVSRRIKRGFYTERSRFESDRINVELARRFANQSGPHVNALNALIDAGDLSGLVNFEFDYRSAILSRDLANARRCVALFQKNSSINLGIDLEEVAWESFAKSEIICSQTNARFESYESGVIDPGVEAVILMAQRKIAQILGPCPSLEQLHFGFGPGASTTCRKRTSARRKLATLPVCSKEAYQSAKQLMALFPAYSDLYPKIGVGRGELSFVPKNAKTHRSIMIEPILNTFVQRGIGRFMKRRLAAFGCNLYDQSVNKSRAQLGSLMGTYATIDLSSASDLISKKVVATLLPVEWCELLTQWRTGEIEYKKKGLMFKLEKFSSMGNGFTFELESLIFYALSVSACKQIDIYPDVSVYGDDIIVPTDAYAHVTETLEKFGFLVNTKKSYFEGSFRESCGGDYMDGFDVRPFFCKGRWTDARLVSLHNHLLSSGYDDREVRSYIVSLLPPAHRLYGPAGYGDGHLHGPYRGTAYRWHEGWQGFVFDTFVKVPKSDSADSLASDPLLPSYMQYLKSDAPPGVEEFSVTSFASRFTPKEYSGTASDPLSLRGGEEVRRIRIYILA